MDKAIKVIAGVGEVGIDTEASPGNGQYYVKLYDGSFDMCGYDTEEEALAELEYLADGECAIPDEYDETDDSFALASAGFGMDEDYGYASDDY